VTFTRTAVPTDAVDSAITTVPVDVPPSLPALGFPAEVFTVTENAHVATIPVTLGADADLTVTVIYTVGADGGVLVFPPGVTSQSLMVGIADDTVDEADEVLPVTLQVPTYAVGGLATALLAVIDDDLPPTVVCATGAYSLTENAQLTKIDAILSNASGFTVTVDYTVAYTATAAEQGTSDQAVIRTGQVAFAPGETSSPIVAPWGEGNRSGRREMSITLMGADHATLGETNCLTLNLGDSLPLNTIYLPVIGK
jgi:hypothetical protein